jgi:phenylpyruvate tautomerase PptA (4-oxalocrotonate tautomerase family)
MATRNFAFTWHKNEKCIEPIIRHNSITVSNASDNIAFAAKAATELFCKTFGNLKKNTVVHIQELDKEGNPIGEPIVPENEEK